MILTREDIDELNDWAAGHQHPAAALRIATWLKWVGADWELRLRRDDLVKLVCMTVKEMADEAERYGASNLVNKFDGGPVNSGLCRGGPYNMKSLHHPTGEFMVSMTTNTRRGIVTRAQDPTRETDLALLYGVYRYRPEHKDWLWHPPKEA